MQQATQESVAAIKKIGATIGQISNIASSIATAAEQQGSATQEIARNVQNVAEGTQEAPSTSCRSIAAPAKPARPRKRC